MNENYLIHYGVLGMKWGIRRYQNKDGTRTALGKKHEKESNSRSGESKLFKQEKISKDKPPVSPAERIAKESTRIVDNTKNVADSIHSIKKRNSKSQSKSKTMSDEELRKAINRMELERRYDSLTEEETSKGYETFKDVIGIIGGVTATVASTALIVSVIKSLH